MRSNDSDVYIDLLTRGKR